MNDIAALGRAMRNFVNVKEAPTEEHIERTLTSIRTELITQATAEPVKVGDQMGQVRDQGDAQVATVDEVK